MASADSPTPQPTSITLHERSRTLEIGFTSGETFRIPFELMRVLSPSAEVKGHGPGQAVLQIGKQDVRIAELRPIGNYAVLPVFSDGHESGIFSWDYLYFLGSQQSELWARYESDLRAAGFARDGAPLTSLRNDDLNH